VEPLPDRCVWCSFRTGLLPQRSCRAGPCGRQSRFGRAAVPPGPDVHIRSVLLMRLWLPTSGIIKPILMWEGKLEPSGTIVFGLGRTVNANMSCLRRFLRRKKGHELEQPPGPQTALVISRSLRDRYRPEVGSPFFQLRF